MIRLVQTSQGIGFASYELHAGDSEQSVTLIGFADVRMHGSIGVNGTCTVLDAAHKLVQEVPVVIPDGSAATLRSIAVGVIRGGFPDHYDVA